MPANPTNRTKQLRLRRGTTAEHANFTGAVGELTVDTDLWTIRLHDNSVTGGHVIATKSYVDDSVDSAFSNVQSLINEITHGPKGDPGNDGANGQGVPIGGSAGQVLAKIDSNDYNTEWVNQTGGVGGPTDRLVNGDHELVLNVGGGGAGYVTFPEVDGTQIGIQGSEITSQPGSNGLTLTAIDGNILLTTHADVYPALIWEFDRSGTIRTPLLFPVSFTAVLDEDHRTVGEGSYTGPAWEFNLEWQVSPSGQIELLSDTGPLPSLVAGYADGQTFEFTEADHGIPGYTLTIVLSNVDYNPAGWTANLSFSEPPVYPSTINSAGAIKLTANENSWTFGTDGNLTLPGNYSIGPGEGSLGIISESAVAIIADSSNSDQLWIFGADGTLTLPNGTNIYGTDLFKVDAVGGFEFNSFTDHIGGGKKTWKFDNTGYLNLPGGTAYITSESGSVNIQANGAPGSSGITLTALGSSIVSQADLTLSTAGGEHGWTFGTDGKLTLANGADISSSDIGFSYTAPSNGPGGYSVSENSLTVGIPNPSWAADILANPNAYHLDFNGGPAGVAIGGISGPAPSTNVYTLTGTWPANDTGFPMTIASDNYVDDLTTISSDNGLQVSTTGGSWTFGLDGTTTFPNNAIKQVTGTDLSIATTGVIGLINQTCVTVVSSGTNYLGNSTYGTDYPGTLVYVPSGPGPLVSGNFVVQSTEIFAVGDIITIPASIQNNTTATLQVTSTLPYSWSFATTGQLNLPRASNGNARIQSADDIDILSENSLWTFGTDGNLTLPNGGTIADTTTTMILTPNSPAQVTSLVLRSTFNSFLTADYPTAQSYQQWLHANYPESYPDDYVSTGTEGTVISITLYDSGGVQYVQGDVEYVITGTGITAADFTPAVLTGTFLAANWVPTGDGYSYTNTIMLMIANDAIVEGQETFTLTITTTGTYADYSGSNYLRVNIADGTTEGSESGHIHLISENMAQTSIFLGNDDKYVKVAADDQIYINVPNVDNSATSHTWTFGTDGRLTFPSGMSILQDATGAAALISADPNVIIAIETSGPESAAVLAWIDTDPVTSDQKAVSFSTGNGNGSPYAEISVLNHTLSGSAQQWRFNDNGKLLLPGGNAQIVVENDYGVRIGTGNLNTAPSSHIRIGGADHAFEIFGGPPGYSWKFDADGILTFPGADGFRATFGSVEPVGDVLHSINDLYLESETTVGLTSGADVAELENTYMVQEAMWVDIRDQDEQSGSGGSRPRPWAGMPSYEAYDLIMAYNPGGIPLPGNLGPTAYAALTAYYNWQSARADAGVLINVADKQWVFGVAGDLRVPGTISKTNILQLNSSGTGGGAGNAASVSIDGDNGRLLVRTSDSETNKDWIFGLDGIITLPNGAKIGPIEFPNGNDFYSTGADSYSELNWDNTNYTWVDNLGTTISSNGKNWAFDTDGKLRLPGSTNSAFIQDVDDRMVIANYGTDYWTTLAMNSAEGKFDFGIKDTDVGGTIIWSFDKDSSTTFPGKLHGAVDLSPVDNLPVGHTLSIAPARDHSSKSFNFRIDQYSGPYSFTRAYLDMPVAEFRKQVAITFAHDNDTGGYIHMQGSNVTGDGLDNAFNIQSTGADIKLSATGQIWKFGTDGTTLFPDAAIDGGTAPIELKSRSWSQLTYNNADMTPAPNKNHSTTFFVEGGDALLEIFRWDGDSVMQHRQWTFSNDGSLTLPTGGEIKTEAGTGDVVIEANDGTARTWTFGGDGDITLPAGGDIVNSTGVSQLTNRVEGSWTVTAGTNTYSFTVPASGTYTMWVKGNIPNGIITWNATLSISNTNVPAIGQQYAWNYTGGGSPILLTAIPNQIRGAAGTISTDATYAGTTSNRFDFGISNTSGSTQTIYYGYTKV